MPYGSGLSAQIGFAQETPNWGTITTPTRFYEFNSESLSLDKTIVQGGGLRAGIGSRYPRSTRRNYTMRQAGGDISLNLPTKGLGLLLKNMIGSAATAVQQAATAAYRQDHTPGTLTGKSLTIQKGVPQTDGTVKPFTYAGSKITDWEIACALGEVGTLSITVDSKDETTATALATASYPAGTSEFFFAEGSLLLGGTVTTTSGVASIAGGVSVASVTGASVTGSNPMKTDRFYFGGSGTKAEQIENDWGSIGGSLSAEFVSQAAVYDVFAADGATALELKFVGANIATTYFDTLDIIIPSIRFDGESPQVGGPDVVGISADFTGLDDGTNPAIQLSYISTDTTV